MAVTVLIEVSGGVVQAAWSDDPDHVDLKIIDWDDINTEEDEEIRAYEENEYAIAITKMRQIL